MNPENRNAVQSNESETALCIPLCIDYILEKTMCEDNSLAKFLQLDVSLVRRALYRLVEQGILDSDEMKK